MNGNGEHARSNSASSSESISLSSEQSQSQSDASYSDMWQSNNVSEEDDKAIEDVLMEIFIANSKSSSQEKHHKFIPAIEKAKITTKKMAKVAYVQEMKKQAGEVCESLSDPKTQNSWSKVVLALLQFR